MPSQSKSQEIGRTGERWFISQLPPNWLFQPPLDDVGVDGVVVICEPGPLNGVEFRVQIKSSAKWTIRNECIILPGLKRSTVLYWLTGFTPTLIVLYETSSNLGYCVWANQLFTPKTETLTNKLDFISLDIPKRMPIDTNVWDALRVQVSGISAALGRNLMVAQTAIPFLRAIFELSGAVKHLYFAQAATPKEPNRTEEQRQLLSELEIHSHRDVVRAIQSLDRELHASGITLDGLKQYADEYIKRCSGFITNFQQVVDAGDQRLTSQFYHEGLALERSAMMNSIVSTIHELTQAAVGATSKPDDDGAEKRRPAANSTNHDTRSL